MNKRFNLLWCLAAAAMFAGGCDDSDAEYDPGIRFSRTGDVALIASMENCTTRASLVNTGETRWLGGDAIGVVCTDDSVVELALDGTGDTRRAIFAGTLPDGKELGAYALYPASASVSENRLSVELPRQIAPATAGSCSVMVAEIGNTYNIVFRQLMSYVTLRIDNISDDTATIRLTADKNLSGLHAAALPEALETGLAACDGSETLTIVLPEKRESTVTATFAVPVGEYASLTATTCDAEGKQLAETECLTTAFKAVRGAMRSLSATLPKVVTKKPPIEGTILVAGIYWATGNLQHFEGSTDEGFRTDWRLAPEQWQYVNYEHAAASGKVVTFQPTDYKQCDHFNWGGIANPFDNAEESIAQAAVGMDIAGKMYTSQDCTATTTDFEAAKFGDLAYWASNGKFRLPTKAELQKLFDETSRQYGSYKVADGKFVTGFLFTDPEEGETPTISDIEVEFTDEDLAKGLFLPKSGRRYNKQSYTVNNQGTQCPYWGSESVMGDDATQPCYGIIFYINSAKIQFPYWNKDFDAKAGFSIRPVYIEK